MGRTGKVYLHEVNARKRMPFANECIGHLEELFFFVAAPPLCHQILQALVIIDPARTFRDGTDPIPLNLVLGQVIAAATPEPHHVCVAEALSVPATTRVFTRLSAFA